MFLPDALSRVRQGESEGQTPRVKIFFARAMPSQKNRDAVGLHDNLRNCRWVASPPLLCFQRPPPGQSRGREACNSRQESSASLIIIVGPYEAFSSTNIAVIQFCSIANESLQSSCSRSSRAALKGAAQSSSSSSSSSNSSSMKTA